MIGETPELPESPPKEVEVLKPDEKETTAPTTVQDTTTSNSDAISSNSDAVAQGSVAVVGENPSLAESNLYQIISQLTSQSVQNTVDYQQRVTQTQQTMIIKDIANMLLPMAKQPTSNNLKAIEELLTIFNNLK
ncbi:MAG: hypothetical protein F6K14_14015 [Symploca sp. SIO2C1]|nr:hypothetical protein [Symploca sp. SIO2C1]